MKLARKYRTRLSLHATYPLEPMPEIVDRLGRGDVLCHTFQAKGPYSILDENGRIFPEVWSARERASSSTAPRAASTVPSPWPGRPLSRASRPT